jgi:hypothetical protein
MRRVRPQVLPQGCPTVRDDGLWSPVPRPRLHPRQRWLAGHVPHPPPTSPPPARPSTASWTPALRAGHPCPSCAQGLLVVLRSLPRPPRGPPCATPPAAGCTPARASRPQRLRAVAPWPRSVHLLPPSQGFLGMTALRAMVRTARPSFHTPFSPRCADLRLRAPRKSSRQAAPGGLKCHTGQRSGSVQHRVCVGGAPQKLLFVSLLES